MSPIVMIIDEIKTTGKDDGIKSKAGVILRTGLVWLMVRCGAPSCKQDTY